MTIQKDKMSWNGAFIKETIIDSCLDKERVRKAIDGIIFYTAQGCFTIDKEVTKKKLLEELKL